MEIRHIWSILCCKPTRRRAEDVPNRFDFLDGYRGSLALVVIMTHSRMHNQCELVNLSEGYSQSYSISGFFMLSAFLLTYRLLLDFSKTTNPLQPVFHIINWNQGDGKSLSEVALLKYPGLNHLWTIPVEIKYYGVIPLFCLVAHILGSRLGVLQLAAAVTWTIWDQRYNVFKITIEETKPTSPVSSQLKSHFAVFLIGSEAALALFLIEKQDFAFIKSNWFRCVLDYASVLVGLIGLRTFAYVFYQTENYTFKSHTAIYWSICLLMTMLSHPNMISNFFSGWSFLRRLGKYSFSCYLLHWTIVVQMKAIIKRQPEVIVASIAASYYVAMISFYLIENNLIRVANFLCAKLDVFQAFLISPKYLYKPV